MAAPRKQFTRHDDARTARFLTFSAYHRLPLLQNDRIKDHFVETFTRTADARSLTVLAWVLMPEHVHLILLPETPGDVAAFLTSLKTSVAMTVLKRWRELDASILSRITDSSGCPHFWQLGGGYDRCVWGTELLEKIAYCHRNPITRGLVRSSTEWKWSSARAYEASRDYVGPSIGLEKLPDVDRPLT